LLHLAASAHATTAHEQAVQAIEAGDLGQVMSLVNNGLNINYPIDNEGTLLQISIIEEQAPIAPYLITQDANVNAMNEQEHRSPLHIATELGNTALVELLLRNQANPDIQNESGRTPLFLTVAPVGLIGFDTAVVDYSDTRTLLIANGADVNSRDPDGWSPLLIASVEQNTEAVAELNANGAKFDQIAAKTLATKGKCANCHFSLGRVGVATAVHFPHLAAQHAAYTAKQLKDYRDGHRKVSPMTESASYLSDELIEELSKFYEKQPRVRKQLQTNNDFSDRGKEIYNKNCSQCHGIDGVATTNPVTPVLAGQGRDYVTRQMNKYKDSTRTNDPDQIMRLISKSLSEAQIVDVAHYIQTL